jgi:tRNA 2-thiouridine synthesizing protein A
MMNTTLNEAMVVELDLSGFNRRLPVALIQWQLEQLGEGESLSLAVDPNMTIDRLQTLLAPLGARMMDGPEGGNPLRIVLMRGTPSARILELDMRGRRCPAPVIEARRKLRRMAPGERLRMVADCTGAPAEMDTWAAHSRGVNLLGRWRQDDSYVFLLGRSQA